MDKPQPKSEQPSWSAFNKDIPHCMLFQRRTFSNRLKKLRLRHKQNKNIDDALQRLHKDIEKSKAQRVLRKDNLPTITYPEDLPISQKRQVIADAITANQVTIIAGETGSGKTTQIPKICLELGRGIEGSIGHTQPRRIAARSVATRIAEELKSPLGKDVGYKIRFSDHTQANTYIKLMTDGILLAEIQHDPRLLKYDTIIIDEAHERSLNIDFLLGYIKNILPKRPDLKVIITSATINTETFSKFFHDAPVIEVSGRSFPVDIEYLPPSNEDDDKSLENTIIHAVDEAAEYEPLGDILIFLPGEREIRDISHALNQHAMRNTEVLPLFSRLSPAEQDKIFKGHKGRRIVLATNVAETSLTVPGIRFVIDSGLARISRYSPKSKVQQLPIEPISQASANQRAGRCGRVAAGICFRLYSEENFNNRPEHTDPEILRTNLANVILQMVNLGLGDIHKFDFMQPPEKRSIQDGYKLLEELQAIDKNMAVTKQGKQLTRLPVDPRFGRMLLQADKERSLHEVLIIVAALSVQDPKIRPADKQQKADEKHRSFTDKTSEFLSWLKLWQWYQEQRKHLSKSQLRKTCTAHFLSYLRMREWADLHGQLLGILRELKLTPNQEEAKPDEIHRAMLSGLLSQVIKKREETKKGEAPFIGARGLQVHLFPGSPVSKKPARWLMAGSLVETSRLFARSLAPIKPEWLEALAPHLLKRTYSEPHWSKKRAQVCAYETVTLYGLIIISRRIVHFGAIDPIISRELFIRHALVHHEFHSFGKWFKHNTKLLAEIEKMEAMHRRRDFMSDEQTRFDFFDALIPEHIYSGKLFEQWRKKAEKDKPRLLYLSKEILLEDATNTVNNQQFPTQLETNGLKLKLQYHFDPNHHADGITVQVPIMALGQLKAEPFEWLVPGMLEEKITTLIKALPKSLRKNFVPAPQFAAACAANLSFAQGSLLLALSRELQRMTGIYIPTQDWQIDKLPAHLCMKFEIHDPNNKIITTGHQLGLLQKQYAHLARVDTTQQKHTTVKLQQHITRWDFGELPEVVTHQKQGMHIAQFPALVDKQTSVSINLLESEDAAVKATRQGIKRLLMLSLHQQVDMLRKNMPKQKELALYYVSLGKAEGLRESIISQTFEQVFFSDLEPLPRNAKAFQMLLDKGRAKLVKQGANIAEQVCQTLQNYAELQHKLGNVKAAALAPVVQDIQQQMQHMIYPDFVQHTPSQWLPHMPRFIQAALLRLEKAGQQLAQDSANTKVLHQFWLQYEQQLEQCEKHNENTTQLIEFRWLLEELRVSLFAQSLKTSVPISMKRVEKHWSFILSSL